MKGFSRRFFFSLSVGLGRVTTVETIPTTRVALACREQTQMESEGKDGKVVRDTIEDVNTV